MRQILFYPNAISLLLKTFLYVFFFIFLSFCTFSNHRKSQLVFPPPPLILPQFSAFHLLFGPNSPGRKADTFSTALHSRVFIPPVSHSGVCARAFIIIFTACMVWNMSEIWFLEKYPKNVFLFVVVVCVGKAYSKAMVTIMDSLSLYIFIFIYVCCSFLDFFKGFDKPPQPATFSLERTEKGEL